MRQLWREAAREPISSSSKKIAGSPLYWEDGLKDGTAVVVLEGMNKSANNFLDHMFSEATAMVVGKQTIEWLEWKQTTNNR